jgi:hypothetical protein
VIFGAMWASSATSVSSASDNGPGNTWAVDNTADVTGAPQGWIVRDDGTGLPSGTVITIQFSASVDGRVARAYRVPGIDSASPVVVAQSTAGTGPTWASTAHTVATDNALFSVAYNESGQSGSTPSAGTEIFDDTDTYGNGFVAHWRLGTGASITNAGAWGSGASSVGIASVVYRASADTDPYVGAGAAATASSGNITPALPGSLQTNDALILDITALDNVDCSVAVSGGSGNAWTRKGAQNNGTGLRKEVWWKRRGSGDADTAAAVTHTGGGKIIARVHAIRVPGTGDPFEAFAFENVAAAASGDFPDITTLTADAFMMFGLGYGEDFTTGPSISAAQGLTLTERDETEVT